MGVIEGNKLIDGRLDGCCVGSEDGLVDGVEEADCVGPADGDTDLVTEGDCDGAKVGREVGSSVTVGVGAKDGIIDSNSSKPKLIGGTFTLLVELVVPSPCTVCTDVEVATNRRANTTFFRSLLSLCSLIMLTAFQRWVIF